MTASQQHSDSQANGDSQAIETIILQNENDLAGLVSLVESSSSERVAITKSSSKAILNLSNDGAHCQWLPQVRKSFADFVYHELGGQIASVWLPLADEGLIIAARDSWLSVLQQCESLQEALVTMSWEDVSPQSCLNIDWPESRSFLPVLEPQEDRISNSATRQVLQQAERWLPESLNRKSPDFQAVLAGFYQWYDALHMSHEFSQAVQYTGRNKAGDYWHAIMHRREGDYSNSKYWFRNVGSHPLYPTLKKAAKDLAEQSALNLPAWSPEQFVDLCSRAEPGSDHEKYARRIQALEMVLLMRHTLDDATL
ncbi:hypothetical protein [Rubinisphaera sp.]|uniref:hypothetical protein n=1 Tax=Rubinisphaera sp. TaxID=2024857 RepID=UPI000C0E019F|nr:hypothetical protein [Rubinisphaera sp.]MBV09306.1 hypothetical protein [Rubinisphaera sp.]HCS54496.1 hypothetical protein [Planctomycetaceae bacterium]